MKKLFLSLVVLLSIATITLHAGAFSLAGQSFDTNADAPDITTTLNALTDVTATGTISYIAATNTLTLNNATISCSSDKNGLEITSATTLTINLIGSNTLSQTRTNTGEYFSGIQLNHKDANLTISGEGNLKVLSYQNLPIRIAAGSLTIDSTTLEAKNNSLTYFYLGIGGHNEKGGDLVINNAIVKTSQISYLNSITLTNSSILHPKNNVYSIGTAGDYGQAIFNGTNIANNITIFPNSFTVDNLQYQLYTVTQGARQLSVPVQTYNNATLTIPDSITYNDVKFQVHHINNNAFKNNKSIQSINLKCENIWSNAFEGCTNLNEVTLQEGVKTMSEYAFSNIGATTIHLPASLHSLDANSGSPFARNNFSEITIDEGNTALIKSEDGAIYNSDKTKILAYPYNWTGGKFSHIPATITEIMDETFYACKNISDTLILPATLTKADRAFNGANMKCVIVNSDTFSLSNVFQGTPALQEVIIGKNVTHIGQLMFANCSNIEKIRILSPSMPNWQYGTDDSWASFNGETFTKAKLYVPCGQIATYQANENKWAHFTTIVDTLIYDINVTCPRFPHFKPEHISLTTSNCNNATLTFNQDIINTYASQYQWMGWAQTENDILTNLNHISMINVTSDRTLMAVFKPILNVGDTFSVKTSEGVAVTYKILTKTTDNMTVTVGVNDNSGPTAIDPSYTGTVTIPDKVKYFDEEYNVVQIGYYAFAQCTLTGINLPNTLTKICQDAFNKSGLTSIVIPNSVVEMESEVFIDCDNLASVTLPNTIERLNVRLFQNCDILSEITIPNSVKYLESGVFSNCGSLTTIYWTPANILRIGNNAFGTTPWLNAIESQNNGLYVDNIYLYENRDNTITSITVKEGTRMIAAGAAQLMSAVTDITIPASVTTIGDLAFWSSTSLQRCTLYATTPPVIYDANNVQNSDKIANDLFGYGSYNYHQGEGWHYDYNNNLLIFVPKSAVASYKENKQWAMMKIRPIGGWDVTFTDGNGYSLGETQHIEEGQMPTLPTTIPTKSSTTQWDYTFNNQWLLSTGDTVIAAQTTYADITYTALFDSTPHPYTITFVNYNGTQLYQSQIGYGLAITYGGTTPVKDTTEQYSYAFKGWSDGFENGVTTVTGDKTYTAQFDSTPIPYTITFVNYDGTQLYQSQIGYGLAITYGGTTPVKDTTEQYSYAFKGWSDGFENGVTTVTGDKTYTAQFDSAYRSYTIVFLDGLTNDTLLRVDTVYGATVTPPSIPQHEGYKSNGWDSDDYTNVYSDLTITATYTQQTGIEQRLLDSQKSRSFKRIENGKIVIIKDTNRYSVNGEFLGKKKYVDK